MADAALRYLPLIAALASLAVAVFALLRSLRDSPATRARKPTPPSLAECNDSLESALSAEKISHQLAKLENRLRMREVRTAKGSPGPAPPNGADKAALFRYYGFRQVGPAFAQHQLDLERANDRKD